MKLLISHTSKELTTRLSLSLSVFECCSVRFRCILPVLAKPMGGFYYCPLRGSVGRSSLREYLLFHPRGGAWTSFKTLVNLIWISMYQSVVSNAFSYVVFFDRPLSTRESLPWLQQVWGTVWESLFLPLPPSQFTIISALYDPMRMCVCGR